MVQSLICWSRWAQISRFCLQNPAELKVLTDIREQLNVYLKSGSVVKVESHAKLDLLHVCWCYYHHFDIHAVRHSNSTFALVLFY